MKKSTKIVSAALALCTCIGVVTLAGCAKGGDPYSNMQAISKNAFNAHLSSSVLEMERKQISITSNMDNAQGERTTYYDISLLTYTVNNNVLASGNIFVRVDNSAEEAKNYSAKVWLANNILYVDNGQEKYSVTYNGKNYYNGNLENSQLTESQLFQRYVCVGLEEANKNNSDSTSNKTFNAETDDSVYYMKDSGNDHYYEMAFKSGNVGFYSNAEGTFKFKFNDKNRLVDYELKYSADPKFEYIGTVPAFDIEIKITSSSSAVELPADYNTWNKM